MQNEIVLVFSKGFITEEKAFEYITGVVERSIANQVELIQTNMGVNGYAALLEEIKELKTRISEGNFSSFRIKRFYPDAVYIVNQLNNVFVAMPISYYVQNNVSDIYKKTHLEYNEVVNRYYETAYGATTESLLKENAQSATMDSLDMVFSEAVVKQQVFNVLNNAKWIITEDMAIRSTDYFSGTKEERDEKFLLWLKGEEISFDSEVFKQFRDNEAAAYADTTEEKVSVDETESEEVNNLEDNPDDSDDDELFDDIAEQEEAAEKKPTNPPASATAQIPKKRGRKPKNQ